MNMHVYVRVGMPATMWGEMCAFVLVCVRVCANAAAEGVWGGATCVEVLARVFLSLELLGRRPPQCRTQR